MTRDTRTYGHFCTLARSLEVLGDRWSLLVVRDLVVSRRRFTDLMELLGGITPKTLSQRLKDLERHGIVHAEREPGRREVWYELTPAGRDLAPALEALTLWGFRHPHRPRQPGEPLHPEHLLHALRVVLGRESRLQRPARWRFTFTDDGDYTLAFDGKRWDLLPAVGEAGDADVVVTTTSEAWANHITTPAAERAADPPGVDVAGKAGAVTTFWRALARFPDAAREPAEVSTPAV